jgi:hypothetical protein
MTLYADFSWTKPSPAAVKAAGYVGVIGYLSYDTTGKNLTPIEAACYRAAGLDVLFVWENGAWDALSGASTGATHGAAALAQAQAAGNPATSPLFVNVGDFAAEPGQIQAIAAYYDGFCSAIPGQARGGYGTGYIIDQLAASGRAGVWWQNAMDDSGESGASVSANANLYQRVTPTLVLPGGDYDEDVVGKSWTIQPDPSPPNPAPLIAKEPAMFAFDPTSGGFWATDANGECYAEDGAPFVAGLNQHPAWQAGQAESGGANQCVGVVARKDRTGQIGIAYMTNAPSGGTPYSFYRFNRAGQPE